LQLSKNKSPRISKIGVSLSSIISLSVADKLKQKQKDATNIQSINEELETDFRQMNKDVTRKKFGKLNKLIIPANLMPSKIKLVKDYEKKYAFFKSSNR
jgi:hypothetical protein